jgi:transcriptional regulator with XRE-family HTH domain
MASCRKDQPEPERLRLRRIQLGLCQGALASRLGVSFQAVQKYETSDIRISAGRLYGAAQALEVSPGFFFEGYPVGIVAKNMARDAAPTSETFDRREVTSLVRGFYGIRDPQLRKLVLRVTAGSANSPRLHTFGYRAHRGGRPGRCRDRAIARRRFSRSSPCEEDSKASQLENRGMRGEDRLGDRMGDAAHPRELCRAKPIPDIEPCRYVAPLNSTRGRAG